jgi:hypothetical protein
VTILTIQECAKHFEPRWRLHRTEVLIERKVVNSRVFERLMPISAQLDKKVHAGHFINYYKKYKNIIILFFTNLTSTTLAAKADA